MHNDMIGFEAYDKAKAKVAAAGGQSMIMQLPSGNYLVRFMVPTHAGNINAGKYGTGEGADLATAVQEASTNLGLA